MLRGETCLEQCPLDTVTNFLLPSVQMSNTNDPTTNYDNGKSAVAGDGGSVAVFTTDGSLQQAPGEPLLCH